MLQASRDHYCINKQVMKKANKDEECTNLIASEGAGCQYFKNTASKMYGQQSNLALQVPKILKSQFYLNSQISNLPPTGMTQPMGVPRKVLSRHSLLSAIEMVSSCLFVIGS